MQKRIRGLNGGVNQRKYNCIEKDEINAEETEDAEYAEEVN